MGFFGDFAKMEVGRRAGKWAGDKVFGKEGEVSRNEDELDEKQAELEQKKLDLEEEKLEREQEKLEREQEKLEEAERKNKLEKITSFSFGSDKDEISEKMNHLFSLLVSEDDKGLRNACIEKIEFGMMKLKNAGGQAETEFFTKKLEDYKNKHKGFFSFLKK